MVIDTEIRQRNTITRENLTTYTAKW